MQTIVIYKSMSGFTQKYAEWIADELNADILNLSEVNKNVLEKYDIIIYGGGLHASGIAGLKRMKKNLKKIENKKLVVFATGASPKKRGLIDKIKKENFNNEKVEFFYFRGGFDFGKLTLGYKIFMFIFVNILKLKSKKSEDDIGMISAYEKPIDFTKKEYINDLIKSV